MFVELDVSGQEQSGQLWANLAQAIEQHVDSFGWGAPNSLWMLRLFDVRERFAGLSSGPAGGTLHAGGSDEVLCGVELTDEVRFDSSPLQVLAGLTSTDELVVGAVVSCEVVDDSGCVPVRVVAVVVRDGSAVVLRRRRGEQVEQVVGDNWAVWALRRVFGLSSHAGVDGLVLADVVRRTVAAPVVDMVTSGSNGGSLSDGYVPGSMRAAVVRLAGSLTWNALHDSACERYLGRSDGAFVSRFVGWCDADMWARYVDQSLPSTDELRHMVAGWVVDGAHGPVADDLVELLEADPSAF